MKWNDNQAKRTLWEEWKLIWRGMKILNQILPRFWLYQVLCIGAEIFAPYFGLYMSAQLVNELAGSAITGDCCGWPGLRFLGDCCSPLLSRSYRAAGRCAMNLCAAIMRPGWPTYRMSSSTNILRTRM